jgi:hypothetical protein
LKYFAKHPIVYADSSKSHQSQFLYDKRIDTAAIEETCEQYKPHPLSGEERIYELHDNTYRKYVSCIYLETIFHYSQLLLDCPRDSPSSTDKRSNKKLDKLFQVATGNGDQTNKDQKFRLKVSCQRKESLTTYERDMYLKYYQNMIDKCFPKITAPPSSAAMLRRRFAAKKHSNATVSSRSHQTVARSAATKRGRSKELGNKHLLKSLYFDQLLNYFMIFLTEDAEKSLFLPEKSKERFHIYKSSDFFDKPQSVLMEMIEDLYRANHFSLSEVTAAAAGGEKVTLYNGNDKIKPFHQVGGRDPVGSAFSGEDKGKSKSLALQKELRTIQSEEHLKFKTIFQQEISKLTFQPGSKDENSSPTRRLAKPNRLSSVPSNQLSSAEKRDLEDYLSLYNLYLNYLVDVN